MGIRDREFGIREMAQYSIPNPNPQFIKIKILKTKIFKLN